MFSKAVGLVVEGDLDDLQRRVPAVDLAPAAGQEFGQMRQHLAPAQAENRVRLVEGAGDGEIGVGRGQRRKQAGNQIGRQEGRIAGGGGDQRVRRRRQRGVQPGQRAGEIGNLVGHDAVAEGGVTLAILVGVDQQFVDLRRQSLDHPGHHRPSAQFLQALVDATHAPAEAAGQDDSGNFLVHRVKRSAPVNRR